MKRSERISSQARHDGWCGATLLVIALAAGVWGVGLWLTHPTRGFLLVLLALFLLRIALWHIAEAYRLSHLAEIERTDEFRRTIRPRL